MVRGLKAKHIIFTILLSSLCFSQAAVAQVLGFKAWKNQQVNEAQNRSVRLLNRITVVRATTGNLKEIINLESELRGQQQYVEVVKDLNLEDYFNVYLSRHVDNPTALARVAKTMSRQEVAELLRLLLRAKSDGGTVHSSPSTISGWANPATAKVRL